MRQRIKRQASAKEVGAIMRYYEENPEVYAADKTKHTITAETFKDLHPTKASRTTISYSRYVGRQYKIFGLLNTISSEYEAECLIKSGFKIL